MIQIYKIGIDFYKNKDGDIVDKNGGYYEYEYIRNELSFVNVDNNTKMLVILNGLFRDDTEEWRLLNYMTRFDKVVFIMTDIVSINNNLEIIRKSDYVLHQCPYEDIKDIGNAKQMYSFVPELFYKYTHQNYVQDNKLIFGGGVRTNEDKIMRYLNSVPSVAFLKTDTIDTRIPYKDFICELSKHKYALIISRQQYAELGWITPRFVEAIAVNSLPIVDSTYDKNDYFEIDKIYDEFELNTTIAFYNRNTHARKKVIQHYRNRFREDSNKFLQLIKEIYYGNNS